MRSEKYKSGYFRIRKVHSGVADTWDESLYDAEPEELPVPSRLLYNSPQTSPTIRPQSPWLRIPISSFGSSDRLLLQPRYFFFYCFVHYTTHQWRGYRGFEYRSLFDPLEWLSAAAPPSHWTESMSTADTQPSVSQRASRSRRWHRGGPSRRHNADARQIETTGGVALDGQIATGDNGISQAESQSAEVNHTSSISDALTGRSTGNAESGFDHARTIGRQSNRQSNNSQRREERPDGPEARERSPRNVTSRAQPARGGRAGGRRFDGHLTSPSSESRPSQTAAATSTLHADAPEFRPTRTQSNASIDARHIGPSSAAKGFVTRSTRGRRSSKSSAPDVSTRIHEDIAHGVYECAICTNEVGTYARIWSCRTCWTVFHLSCIKKWSKNGALTSSPETEGRGLPPPRNWRCPGCNLPQDVLPSDYSCWCGKDIDPRSLPGLPPHSCGQTCGRPRIAPKKCPHPCELLCHAGPCPPCNRMGPNEPCYCGKETLTKRCVDTDYDHGWSCGTICDDLMPCAEHKCLRTCHDGLCGICDVSVDARCYCGKIEKLVPCHQRGQERISKERVDGKVESWIGSFTCYDICGRYFDCGKHRCQQDCHAQKADVTHCPRSPELVVNCPCGKTRIADIQDTPRRSCEDPIPNCKEKCLKKLVCGHECTRTCHVGDCMPCLQSLPISCRCGRTESRTVCHQGITEPPQCRRLCKATLNCGRHECAERCCPGERMAMERQATKRKQRPLDAAPPPPMEEIFEAEHICTRVCGRKLKCGNHYCTELCHKGACKSCREAIFDEVSCQCGRTVLEPPLPCGTQSPTCRFDCERPKNCGHPQLSHNCHGDDEPCPKCPFLTERVCMCRRRPLKISSAGVPTSAVARFVGRCSVAALILAGKHVTEMENVKMQEDLANSRAASLGRPVGMLVMSLATLHMRARKNDHASIRSSSPVPANI